MTSCCFISCAIPDLFIKVTFEWVTHNGVGEFLMLLFEVSVAAASTVEALSDVLVSATVRW